MQYSALPEQRAAAAARQAGEQSGASTQFAHTPGK